MSATIDRKLITSLDDTAKMRLVNEILIYMDENLSISGSAYTRDDFCKLCRMILDPRYLASREAAVNTTYNKSHTVLNTFSPLSGLMKHLKILAQHRPGSPPYFNLIRQLWVLETTST